MTAAKTNRAFFFLFSHLSSLSLSLHLSSHRVERWRILLSDEVQSKKRWISLHAQYTREREKGSRKRKGVEKEDKTNAP